MASNNVNKGYHCAWQIHYHMVFPVKYRKALVDEQVTEIIKETASGIAERYAIEMEAIGSLKIEGQLRERLMRWVNATAEESKHHE